MTKNKYKKEKLTPAIVTVIKQHVKGFHKIHSLLEKYTSELQFLCSRNPQLEMNQKKVHKLVYNTFHHLSLDIATHKKENLTLITSELLFEIHQEVINKHPKNGKVLEGILIEMIINYCSIMKPGEDELVTLIFAKLQSYDFNVLKKKVLIKKLKGSCVKWLRGRNQSDELERIMLALPWFSRDFVLMKFFNNKKEIAVFYCKEEYLGHLALLLRFLKDGHYISADHGKGYMKMAARHIRCDGKAVSAAQLNKLCTDNLANPEKFELIISKVKSIISDIGKIKN